jgi:hypothetical protein
MLLLLLKMTMMIMIWSPQKILTCQLYHQHENVWEITRPCFSPFLNWSQPEIIVTQKYH